MQQYLGRSGATGRDKRALVPCGGDSGGDDDGAAGRPDAKRQKVPALARVIVEALKVDSLQKLCSSLEPILRRVVSEEVERALAKLGPVRIGGSCRSSPKRIEGVDGRNLQLHFRSRLSLPLFTGGKVEGEQGTAIHVVLLDASTGLIVTSGPESSSKLDIVVLEGDFNTEDDDWMEEDFESHVVKEREGKRPLLTGELQVSLKEGVGTLGELTFTDNSSWIRSRKFRLGLKISSGFCEGVRIREAITEAFTVKDHRGELYKKHYPPALQDEVWRLEKIGKDGSFHKRLNKSGIYTVEDFLRLVVRDSQRLRSILGSGMSNKMWESLVEHAKTCVLSGKHYIYYSDETHSVGAIFNNIYEFLGLIASEQYYTVELLTDRQKVFADTLVKRAYDNWMHVVEYDDKALLNFKQKNAASQGGSSFGSTNYGGPYNHLVQPQLSNAVMKEQRLSESGLTSEALVSAYNENHLVRYSPQSQVSSNAHVQYESSSPLLQNQHTGSSHQIMRNDSTSLALAPPQGPDDLGFQAADQQLQQSRLNTFGEWHEGENRVVDDFLTEDIRLRSHELLENEDMQQLLRVFSMGSAGSLPEDSFGFQSFMPSPCPNYNFVEGRSRSSSVGWLKIKAALMWGIFIRKKAAERKAQVVELDD